MPSLCCPKRARPVPGGLSALLLAAVGARPAASAVRKPLIVISHGNWATRYAHAWLAKELGKAGYGVLSPSHPGTMFGDLRPEHHDRQLRACRGQAAGFDEASLRDIRRPMVFDTAVADPVLVPDAGSSLSAQRIPGAGETLRDAGHFSDAPLCKPLIGRLLAGQVCEDPPAVDRSEIHARVAADALRFFKARL